MQIIKYYKGIRISFEVAERAHAAFLKSHLDLSEIASDNHFWFEVVLFELIDADLDGIPDKEFGRSFRIVFTDIRNCVEDKHLLQRPSVAIADNKKLLSTGKLKQGKYMLYDMILKD